MIPLPHPTAPLPFTGQPDACGHARTAGQPDACPRSEAVRVGRTAAGAPVFVFNFQPWASLWLVVVHHGSERSNSWVYGSPARLVDFARGLGLHVEAERWAALDEALPPVS